MPSPKPTASPETRASITLAVRLGTPYRVVARDHGVTLGVVSSTVRAARAAGDLPPAGPPLCAVTRGPRARTPEELAQRAAERIRRDREARARTALARAPRPVPAKPPAPRPAPRTRARAHTWTKSRPYTPPTVWRTDEDDTVVRRTVAGDSRADIAAGLGRSVGAVASRESVLRAAGRLPRQPDRSWSVADDAMLAALREEGLAESEVARRLGRSEGAVACRVNKLLRSGVKLGRARGDFRWRPESVALVTRLALAGGTAGEIAPQVGRSVGAVEARIRALRDEGTLPVGRYDVDDDHQQPDRVRYPRPGADPLLAALMAAHAPRA